MRQLLAVASDAKRTSASAEWSSRAASAEVLVHACRCSVPDGPLMYEPRLTQAMEVFHEEKEGCNEFSGEGGLGESLTIWSLHWALLQSHPVSMQPTTARGSRQDLELRESECGNMA